MRRSNHIFNTLFFICLFTMSALAHNSIEFVQNKGQWDGPFLFKAKTPLSTIFLEQHTITYLMEDIANAVKLEAAKHGVADVNSNYNFYAYKMNFVNALSSVSVKQSKVQNHYYNYFLGADSSRWKTELHPSLALDYIGMYDGIDIHIASEKGNIKYDCIVAPHANAAQIVLEYVGLQHMQIQKGNLVLKTSLGNVTELKPYAYQFIEGAKKIVPCVYHLENNKITYEFPNGYDENVTLIIDPTVVFATFTGSTADNWGFTATYDNQGNFYAGGFVSDQGYPTTTGAFQINYAGGNFTVGVPYPCDISISKFNAAGSALIYSTYLGGASNEQPHSMFVDNANNLVVVGRTYSINFPVTPNAYDVSQNGGADFTVTKFNSTGTALVGSTYLGGTGDDVVNGTAVETAFVDLKYNYGDDARSEVIVDNAGNIYVAGATMSSNFPVTTTAIKNTLTGAQDGVVFKLNPSLTTLMWSTYLGGSNADAAYVLALNIQQNKLYVAGGTKSSDFPNSANVLWPTYQGGIADGFITLFQNGGSYPMLKSTFIGQSNYDQCYGIQVDLENNVYAMGQTLGGSFPVSAGVYNNPNSSQFIIKLDSNLSSNLRSTVFGSGSPTSVNISPVAFLVDTCQNVYISGFGGTLGICPNQSNCTGMPTTANLPLPLKNTTDGNDFYFFALSKNFVNLLHGSYYGRVSLINGYGEHVDGGTSRFDKSGVIYQAICGNCGGAQSPPLPTTAGSWSVTNQSNNCNLAAIKIAFQLGSVNAGANANPTAKGCPPFTVNFQNSSTNAVSYEWNFADGSPTNTAATPSHTFLNPGVYNVRLIAINPDACKVRDTSFVTITVDSNQINANFNVVVTDSCGPYRVSITNTSAFSNTPNSSSFTKFFWSFGDGTSFIGQNPGTHNYPDTGTYSIRLIMRDSTSCNSPDTLIKTIKINGKRVQALFNMPDSICLTNSIVLNSLAINANSFTWRFGDGSTSSISPIVKTYTNVGTYTVTLIAVNLATCNKVDSIQKIIKVRPKPKADFTYTPTTVIPNTPYNFINTSTNAVSFSWSFGDGEFSTLVNPIHLYKRKGTFQVCLIAKSAAGCADTLCKSVSADVNTKLDVPTGFSPNGDGFNDILFVRGGGIETMSFKVFNRWGELVFETTDITIGWDGTYKGQAQEMDAYAYVLSATFVDGSSQSKSGNVTLIR